MSGKSKWDYLKAIYVRYQKVSKPVRARILDEFCQVCNYNRKYAIRLLNGPVPAKAQDDRAPGASVDLWSQGDLGSDDDLRSGRLSLLGSAQSSLGAVAAVGDPILVEL
jgi:hypothetical protein